MSAFCGAVRRFVSLCLLVTWSGCLPQPTSSQDEERDPHYLAGRNRISSLDYAGAVEAFSAALEANPRSASAHKELGLLYYQKLANYASAYYHFEQLLKLRPQDPQAEFIRQNMVACKQELARSMFLDPLAEKNQRLLERLSEENGRLKGENTNLQAQVAVLHQRLSELSAALQSPPPSNPPAQFPSPPPAWPQVAAPQSGGLGIAQATPSNPARRDPAPPARQPTARDDRRSPSPASALARTHKVRAGESAYAIARRYGVSLNALLAANPSVDPRRMRPGQVLNLPSR